MPRDLHVVFDDDGRILALAEAAEVTDARGRTLGHQPVERPGQHVVRLTLGDEELAHGPARLLAEFEIDQGASPPALRERAV
jgi:hypothetical protein